MGAAPAYPCLLAQLPYTPTIKVLPEGGVSIDQYIANTDYANAIHDFSGGESFWRGPMRGHALSLMVSPLC